MKVIFLDVDGVLNDDYTADRSPAGFIGIDDEMVANLERIVRKTGAKIVLSSSWRSSWCPDDPDSWDPDAKYLVGKLAKCNLVMIDKTPTHNNQRGAEIRMWLRDHPCVTHWVVLDDSTFPDFEPQNIIPHWVHTFNRCGGLTREKADRAIAILNGEV